MGTVDHLRRSLGERFGHEAVEGERATYEAITNAINFLDNGGPQGEGGRLCGKTMGVSNDSDSDSSCV
jgi:hypothetical protein